jgi:hypothetical protein
MTGRRRCLRRRRWAKGEEGEEACGSRRRCLSAHDLSTQDAWQAAEDSDSQIDLDDDSMNVHFAYDDEDAHVRHQVWFLDAVTVLNEMRAARALGIQTICAVATGVGRQLGVEDMGRSAADGSGEGLWRRWSRGTTSIRRAKGDILRVTRRSRRLGVGGDDGR